MADKSRTRTETENNPSMDALAQLQQAGFGNLVGMSAAWMEALGEMGSEMLNFMSERIKEDVKTQNEILQCKNAADLQHIQAQFVQKAMDQYHDETGKLIEMSTKAFTKATQNEET